MVIEGQINNFLSIDNVIIIGGIITILASIIGGTAVIVRKLTCAKGLAEEALRESTEAKEIAEDVKMNSINALKEERKETIETHNRLYDMIGELKDLITNMKK